MNILFRNDAKSNKIKVSLVKKFKDFDLLVCSVPDTWMCSELGEGEKEIENHGRSQVKGFTQGTIDRNQSRSHGMTKLRAKDTKSQVQDAREL